MDAQYSDRAVRAKPTGYNQQILFRYLDDRVALVSGGLCSIP